jgi:DNA-binding beta-propeller fold protein YncE
VLYYVNAGTATVSALDLKTMQPLGAPVSVGTAFLPPAAFSLQGATARQMARIQMSSR